MPFFFFVFVSFPPLPFSILPFQLALGICNSFFHFFLFFFVCIFVILLVIYNFFFSFSFFFYLLMTKQRRKIRQHGENKFINYVLFHTTTIAAVAMEGTFAKTKKKKNVMTFMHTRIL